MAGKSSSIIEELEKAPAGAITELYVDLSTINASVKFLNKYFFPTLKIFLNKHISFITKITLHSTEKTLHSRVPLVLQILLEIWQPHIVLVLHSFRVETFNNTCIDLLKKNLTAFQCVELKNPGEILHKKLLPILNKLLTLEKNCKLITSQNLAQIPDTITEFELKELSRDEIQYVFLNTPNQVTKIYLKNLDEEALDFVLSNLKLVCNKFEIDYSSLLPELQEKFKITKLSLSIQMTKPSTSEILTNLNEGTLPSNKFAISSLLNNSSAHEAVTPTNNSSNPLVHPIQTPSPSFSKKISDVHRKRLFKCIMDYTSLLQTILNIPRVVKKERNFFEEIFEKFP